MARKLTVKAKDVEGVKRIPARESKLLLSEATVGVKNMSMGFNITEVNSMIPEHAHETEEEVMFLISGQGIFVAGEEEFELVPETAFYAPPGVKHKVINTGNEPLKIVWVYSPPLADHKKK
ncbi:MAG: dimethylsulfonioproprionate lyase family protein [Peptococcaceae bacterium]|jgi:putative monooxygenase|nr:dimethylsulfonioproprionate lyase family protein [Peptococcaceae bacterium]MDH7526267.1 dimethylsulfonioproprionate lyase family protein [Peptococcaceae bacterium]